MKHPANEHVIASDKSILCTGQALLVLEMNAFHAGDENCSAGNELVQNARSNFSLELPRRIYAKMIAIVTASYLQNRRYHVVEIQKLCRHTTSLVALNCSSRPSKYKSFSQTFCLLTVACVQ